MPLLRVLSPGFLTTIQDAGRFGFAHLGVSPGGAADLLAFRLGNLLAHNEENTPALEMTLVGGTFHFEQSSLVSLTGADCEATLDGENIRLWTSIFVRGGQTLQCRATKNGARSYLCMHGGFHLAKVMHSAATHVQTGIGGLQGRALKKGDVLTYEAVFAPNAFAPLHMQPEILDYLRERNHVRITRGPQADFFARDALDTLAAEPYLVTEASNRVGLRLKGEPLARAHEEEMITEGIALGAIQVPREGQPIILFVEHPTTGGYPKIANVIAADLCRVGQLRPRDYVHFQLVRFDEAHDLYREQQMHLNSNALLPL